MFGKQFRCDMMNDRNTFKANIHMHKVKRSEHINS